MASDSPATSQTAGQGPLQASGATISAPMPGRGRVPLCMAPWPTMRHEPQQHRTVEQIPDAMRRGIRSVARGWATWPLFMWGPPGTGKTCAALMLLDYCQGLTNYWAIEVLCEHLIDCDKGQVDTGGLHPVSVSRLSTWRDVKDAQIIVLDEIGGRCKDVSDHHLKTVKRVLDLREGSPLIVISNLRIGQLAQIYGDRIPSRAAAGSILDWSEYPDQRIAHHGTTK